MKYNNTSDKLMSDIATIEQGHLFRKGIRNMPVGYIYLIQPHNVDPEKGLVLDDLHKVREIDVKESSIIGPNDVIIKTKTRVPISFMVRNVDAKYAVTDHFMIIRLKNGTIKPEYLNWYLNSKRARSYLQKMMSGTSVPFLRKATLLEMAIPVPPMEIQERIVGLDGLLKKEKDLTLQILGLKNKLAEQLAHNAMRGV